MYITTSCIAPVLRVVGSGSAATGALDMDTPTSRTPLTIIVVEDNPLDVYLIQWVLRAHELAHELQVIDNGDRAMDYVNQLAHEERRRSPTFMLLDLALPQRDGRELLQRVKAIPRAQTSVW